MSADLALIIRQAAADLPFHQAQALWLVDSCGYRYDQAARAIGCTTDELALALRQGRRRIRCAVAPGSRGCPKPLIA